MMSRIAVVAGALASLAGAGAANAASCQPEFDQPSVDSAITIGVVKSTQASPKYKALAADMYQAAWQRLDFASENVKVLSDAEIADPNALAGLKVIVLPQVRSLSVNQRRTLASWVKGGGGLVSLYQSGRDTEKGVTLTPPLKARQQAKAFPGWGDLSTAYGARILDVGMRTATFSFTGTNPVAQAAARYCGGQLPNFTWKRDGADVAITGELAMLQGGAKPLATLKAVQIRTGGRRVAPGSVFGWSNQYGAGRVVHVGFNLMDAWRGYTFATYYESSDPDAPDTTVALFRGALEWAAGAPAPTA